MKQIHKYSLAHTASLTAWNKIIPNIATHIGSKHIPIFYIIDGNFFQYVFSFNNVGCSQLRVGCWQYSDKSSSTDLYLEKKSKDQCSTNRESCCSL